MAVPEEVNARPCGSAPGERPLVVDPALARGGERAQVGEPPRSQLLREPDQVHEHLGRRLRIGEGAMAGSGRDAEEVRERGEADSAKAALEQAAGQRGGAERRLRQAPAVDQEQLPLEEALVEAGVVGD